MQHKFLCWNVQNVFCAQYSLSLDSDGEEQNSVPLCQIAYILCDFEWWLIFQMCSLIILRTLSMHIYVHHLLFKLEINGAYPGGRGHVTGSGKSFVLKKMNDLQQPSPQLQSGHPVRLARCNFYKPLFTRTSNCYYLSPKQMYFYERGSGIIRHTFHTVFFTLALCTFHSV